ncbi:MAG: hypothetical protein ABSF72_12345 [Candidatus Sulfotelmatobacter sp.]
MSFLEEIFDALGKAGNANVLAEIRDGEVTGVTGVWRSWPRG